MITENINHRPLPFRKILKNNLLLWGGGHIN